MINLIHRDYQRGLNHSHRFRIHQCHFMVSFSLALLSEDKMNHHRFTTDLNINLTKPNFSMKFMLCNLG